MLTYAGTSLLQHSLDAAISTGIGPIVVVLGAHAEEVQKEVQHKEVHIVNNQEWQEGMASSIRCGLNKLLELRPELKAVIIMVCDQPYVTSTLLNDLVKNYEQVNRPIVASKYADSIGTPALFDTTIFASLLALEGDRGAKKLITENPDWLSAIDFTFGDIDIDTPADYERLKAATANRGNGA